MDFAKKCLPAVAALFITLIAACGTNDKFDGNWLQTKNAAGAAVREADAMLLLIGNGKISGDKVLAAGAPVECRKDRDFDVNNDKEIVVKERNISGGRQCVEIRFFAERPNNDTLLLAEREGAPKIELKRIEGAKVDELRRTRRLDI